MSSVHRIHRTFIQRASLPIANPPCVRPRKVFPIANRPASHPAFSAGAALSLQKPNADPTKPGAGNPEFPKISLEGLGISRNVRIVLYVLLSIWGTFETYFYYQAVMRWWNGRKREPPESEPVD
ncbi:hypothetical protein BJX64DRAFT_271518 [Aspergillus heterothallicus]